LDTISAPIRQRSFSSMVLSGTQMILFLLFCLPLALVLSTTPQMSVGGSGWALRFDGYDDFVVLRENLPPPPFSIDFWAQPLDVTDGNGVRTVRYNSLGIVLSKTKLQGGANFFALAYNGGQVYKEAETLTNIKAPDLDPANSEGRLYHYTYTETATGTFSVYINGVLVRSESGVKPSSLWDENALLLSHPWLLGARIQYLGGDWILNDRCFGGILDNLRWWSVALGPDDIKRVMHLRLPLGEVGLHRQWSFDTGGGLENIAQTMLLGGGDTSRSPQWVPSPVAAFGGPVALSMREGAAAEDVKICALISPAVNNASATATFDAQPTLGSLNLSASLTVTLHEVVSLVSNSTQLCGTVRFVPRSPGSEEVRFRIDALAGGSALTGEQTLMIQIGNNAPPVAGAAKALHLNGKDQYASLGVWDLPDDFSLALWVQPTAVVEDAYFLSLHLSSGTNEFLLGHYAGKYWIRIVGVALGFPVGKGTDIVLDTGVTVAQICADRGKAHHVMMTLKCLNREPTAARPASARVTLYVDGMAIGRTEAFPCFLKPLLPSDYDASVSPRMHPTPWELGEEYDAGEPNKHLPGVDVTPSNFLTGILDDVAFWRGELSAGEAAEAAKGTRVQQDKTIVHFSFDTDDEATCKDRQLANGSITCHDINEEYGRAVPIPRFPWTNSRIGDAQSVPSPFWQVAGSPIHKTMHDGPQSCTSVPMQASDVDGDKVTFHLATGQDIPGSAAIAGSTLTFCTNQTGAREVEVLFDVCDPFGLCASGFSGLGSAIFHVLKSGPEILAFQALPDSRELRVVFDEATNVPDLTTSAKLQDVFKFSNTTDALLGTWEDGGAAVRLLLSEHAWPPPSELTVSVLPSGGLRNGLATSFPSMGVSYTLAVVSCPDGTLMKPSEVECTPCEGNSVPVTEAAREFCQPCPLGQVANGGSCFPCGPGYFSDETGFRVCQVCPVGHVCGTAGLHHPLPCPLGSFGDSTGLTACHECSAGMFAAEEGRTACDSCVPGGSRRPDLWTTSKRLSGVPEWLPMEGATAADACGCKSGSYMLNGDCEPCEEGMTCLGKTDIRILGGFFVAAARPSEVWRCHTKPSRCPGGLPGTCATNRQNQSLACTSCVEGTRPADDGSCVDCGGADSLPMIFLGVVVILLICTVYYVADTQDQTTQTSAMLVIVLALGQMVTVYQQLGVIALIDFTWPSPLSDFFKVLLLMNLDIRVFAVDCVARLSPLVRFVLRVGFVVSLFVVLGLVHAVRALVRHRGDLRAHATTIWSAAGSTMMALLLSIVSGMVAPLQCLPHPNGRFTMRSDDAVVCWDSVLGTEHRHMVVVSVFACLMPIAFLAIATRAVLILPHRMSNGDADFLKKYFCLFSRFRVDCHWYVLVSLLRNCLIALIPVIPGVAAQWCSLMMLMLASGFVVSLLMPWRSSQANYFDIFLTYCLLCILGAASLLLEALDSSGVGGFALVVLFCILGSFVGVLGHSVYERVLRSGKPFQFFICHHKASAGNLARLLKMYLTDHEQIRRRVFVDSDDLRDLRVLFTYIRSELDTLVVLCTSQVLQRPWCLGEVTTAYLNKVTVVRVKLPDFVALDEAAINACHKMDGISMLAEHGMSVDMVQHALRWLGTTTEIGMPMEVTNAEMRKLVDGLVHQNDAGVVRKNSSSTRNSSTTTMALTFGLRGSVRTNSGGDKTSSSSQSPKAIILADQANLEAACTARIIHKMLMPLVLLEGNKGQSNSAVHVLMLEEEMPAGVRQVILVCTNGVTERPHVFRALVVASEAEADFLPVVSEPSFRFPTSAFYKTLRDAVWQSESSVGAAASSSSIGGSSEIVRIVIEIFKEIAIEVNPQDHENVLGLRIGILASRLLDAGRKDHGAMMRRAVMAASSGAALASLEAAEEEEPCN